MKDANQQEIRRKEALKISKRIAWYSLLSIPILIAAIVVSVNNIKVSYVLFVLYYIFLGFPIVAIIYAVINKVFKVSLLIPMVIVLSIVFYIIFSTADYGGNSAYNSRIKSDIAQLALVAERYKDANPSVGYGTFSVEGFTGRNFSINIPGNNFVNNIDGLVLLGEIQKMAKNRSQESTQLIIYSSPNAYCIQKVMLDGSSWCLDSLNRVGSSLNGCDAINFDCK